MTASTQTEEKDPESAYRAFETVSIVCEGCGKAETKKYYPSNPDGGYDTGEDEDGAMYDLMYDLLTESGWRLNERTGDGDRYRSNYCEECWEEFLRENREYFSNKRYNEVTGHERYTYSELGMTVPESAHDDEEFDRE